MWCKHTQIDKSACIKLVIFTTGSIAKLTDDFRAHIERDEILIEQTTRMSEKLIR